MNMPRSKRDEPLKQGGQTKPPEHIKKKRPVFMTAEMWAFCLRQVGGASEYLRGLVEADRGRKGD